MDQVEEWRPVPGFKGLYEVSDLGRVASLPSKTWPTRQILSVVRAKRGGYPTVVLRNRSRQWAKKIHRLVCESFNGPPTDGRSHVRHLDGNPLNNTPANLAWGTPSENGYDRVRHGRHPNAAKSECKHGHPLNGSNLYINPASGSRQCRTCLARARRDYEARKATS